MQKLPEIKAAYDWFFAHYEREVEKLSRQNDMAGINLMAAKRDVLERGVFVLMFGQFEKAVTTAFESAVQARSTNPDWTRRRGWDTPLLRSRKVAFEVKLAMVLDSRSSTFGLILKNYATRNHCAHGGTADPVGSIDAFEANLYKWYGELSSGRRTLDKFRRCQNVTAYQKRFFHKYGPCPRPTPGPIEQKSFCFFFFRKRRLFLPTASPKPDPST